MKKGKLKQYPNMAFRRGPSNATIADIIISVCILVLAAAGYTAILWFK